MPAADVASLKKVVSVPPLPMRADDANKGDCGKITIIGGSRGMSGAPCLSARAAYRSGAGLVRIAVPASIWDIVAIKTYECVTNGLNENASGAITKKSLRKLGGADEWADVFVCGPGMASHADTLEEIREFATRVLQPTVLDADGLNAFADGRVEKLKRPNAQFVLTPHPGEMARLLKTSIAAVQADRAKAALECARLSGAVVVLKGAITLVCDGERLYQNSTGNPGMATGGTGDVLTGIIAALIGQGLKTFEAACLGVYLHGFAGDVVASKLGVWSLIASDLINELPKAFTHHAAKKSRQTIRL